MAEDESPSAGVRRASADDAADVGRLLHDFNTEFSTPTPGAAALAERLPGLLEGGDAVVLLAGRGPDGIALIRFRRSIWMDALEAHLQELYVAPTMRGRGLGRALMEATLAEVRRRGAAWIDLGTSVDDTAARGLYESFGFTNREGGPSGPVMLMYEREL